MKKITHSLTTILVASCALILAGPLNALAATTPSLGDAATYGILSDTFTSPTGPTTVNGDVGFTTAPVVAPLGVHTNYGLGAPYATAGAAAAAALTNLNGQGCDFTFVAPAVVLDATVEHVSTTYGPGVYCSTGAMSIGTAGGITLSGAGTYIFRSGGALNAVTGSTVNLGPGASACDVFWTPNGATTLNANSTFIGTVIPVSQDITVLDTTSWIGRALTFGHTVTTPDTNVSITVPTCVVPPVLTLVKTITNDNGGARALADFPLTATGPTIITGVSGAGTITSAVVTAGTYTLSETNHSDYTAGSWSCTNGIVVNGSNQITLASGNTTTCTINNNDIAPQLHLLKVKNGGPASETDFTLTATGIIGANNITGTTPVSSGPTLKADTFALSETNLANYTPSVWACIGGTLVGSNITLGINEESTCTITNTYIPPPAPVQNGSIIAGGFSAPNPLPGETVTLTPTIITTTTTTFTPAQGQVLGASTTTVPSFPDTGFPPRETISLWEIVLAASILVLVITAAIVLSKRAV